MFWHYHDEAPELNKGRMLKDGTCFQLRLLDLISEYKCIYINVSLFDPGDVFQPADPRFHPHRTGIAWLASVGPTSGAQCLPPGGPAGLVPLLGRVLSLGQGALMDHRTLLGTAWRPHEKSLNS